MLIQEIHFHLMKDIVNKISTAKKSSQDEGLEQIHKFTPTYNFCSTVAMEIHTEGSQVCIFTLSCLI